MQRAFKKNINSLDAIFAFVEEFFEHSRIDRGHIFSVNLALEEIFTNMVKYQVGGDRDILISLHRGDSHLRMSLTDFDVERFEPSEAPVPDTEAPLESRKVGGLGLHLVRQLMDQIDYEYSDRVGTITILKTID